MAPRFAAVVAKRQRKGAERRERGGVRIGKERLTNYLRS